jgi:von Willebrand factor type A domain-containing protein
VEESQDLPVDIFAYGFGFRDGTVRDLLTLAQFAAATDGELDPNRSAGMSTDPLAHRLKRLSELYGVPDLFHLAYKFNRFGRAQLETLVKRLETDEEAAQRLADLLKPANQTAGRVKLFRGLQSTLETLGSLGIGAHGVTHGVSSIVGNVNDSVAITSTRLLHGRELDEAQRMIDELASSTDRSDSQRKISETTMPIREFFQLVSRNEGMLASSIHDEIYGRTPMKQCLQLVSDRLARERRVKANYRNLHLIVVSDGQSTDGNPVGASNDLKRMGVKIATCYITDRDVLEPRRLVREPQHGWGEGARWMFDMASVLDPGSELTDLLLAANWSIDPDARLFVQANHSSVVAQFIHAFMRPLLGSSEETSRNSKPG